MKRRLPITRKGEVMLAAISFPPTAADANRHAPAAAHPGKPAAAVNAAPTAASANRPASATWVTGSPPSSAASAAKAVASHGSRRLHGVPGRDASVIRSVLPALSVRTASGGFSST